MKKNNLKSVGFALLVLVGFRAAGNVVYDTFPNYNGGSFTVTNGEELGNELFFQDTFTITNMDFEYYTPNSTFTGTSVGVDLRFYANDGPTNSYGFATPSTLLYDSGVFTDGGSLPAGGSGFHTVNYNTSDFGSLLMPADFTFTLTFSGLGEGDVMQDPLANPTNMFGESYGNYWLNNSGTWQLLTNEIPAALVVDVGGTPTPEPSALYLGACGAVLMLGAAMLRKKRSPNQVKAE